MENLIKDYIQLSIIQKEATAIGDHKANNKAIKKRFEIVKKLNKSGNLVDLKKLLDHEELNVQLWASFDLIGENLFIQECIETLTKIQKIDDGVIGWGAEMTLKRLNKQ
jgi:hypothetical protein